MKIFRRESDPHWAVSLIPFLVLIGTLVLVIKGFGADALGGGSQVALMFAAGVTVAISMIFYKKSWGEFEESIVDNIKSVATSIVILLLIGAVAGSWMVSGVVPTLIYYGMKVITPVIFLFATCVICALIAVMTGSSWTTIATIGVALVGIGTAQGYLLPCRSTDWFHGPQNIRWYSLPDLHACRTSPESGGRGYRPGNRWKRPHSRNPVLSGTAHNSWVRCRGVG